MVPIPKGNEDFRGFGLVEVLWKVLLGVINWHIGEAVQFHDVMHSFQEGLGVGTASLEAKFSSSLRQLGRRSYIQSSLAPMMYSTRSGAWIFLWNVG